MNFPGAPNVHITQRVSVQQYSCISSTHQTRGIRRFAYYNTDTFTPHAKCVCVCTAYDVMGILEWF